MARRFELWPKIETVKAIAIYGGGLLVLWRVFDVLIYVITLDPVTFGVAAIGIIGILASGVVNFFFGLEQGRQQQRAYDSGLNTPTPGSTVVQKADLVQGGAPTVVADTAKE